MTTELIASIVSIVTTGVVGVILFSQIKSQRDLLDNYKEYIKTTSWQNVQKLYDEVKLPQARKEAEDEVLKFSEEWNKANDKQKAELLMYVRLVLNMIKREYGSQKLVIDSNLPNCKPLLMDIYQDSEEKNP